MGPNWVRNGATQEGLIPAILLCLYEKETQGFHPPKISVIVT